MKLRKKHHWQSVWQEAWETSWRSRHGSQAQKEQRFSQAVREGRENLQAKEAAFSKSREQRLCCSEGTLGYRPPQRPVLSQFALPLRLPLTSYFCLDGAVAIPCLAGSFESKRETFHPNTSFCSAGQF